MQPVLGYFVPFLARDLAGLAADAHARVGEEPHPRLLLTGIALGPAERGLPEVERAECRHGSCTCSCGYESTSSRRARPRGRRPGRTSQVAPRTSWIWTIGSSASPKRSFADSPVLSPRVPQCQGTATCC